MKGLDWQVEKAPSERARRFAARFFAARPPRARRSASTRGPTLTCLDTAKRVARARGRGGRAIALGVATSAGVLLGAAFDRLWGLCGWASSTFLTPRVSSKLCDAWCYSLRAFGTTRRFALWNAVSSLCICRDAPRFARRGRPL